ncbi:ferritin-like domain-containing protein [Noviherbaspirillum galbum]|uniref:Ferritin-like domain-containing protein n=1 Tax=Noviherbaspirillum galbum TaxID=2709383 RepID=A0A6B3SKP8_9BURK|nr:ferritin-like domain-containing protein [Noviherbaspirillum galbum]NEX59925.1 ferritin-like domain-containing protein [Noviherbaspirillum galbum]
MKPSPNPVRIPPVIELRHAALALLAESDPRDKAAGTAALWRSWQESPGHVDPAAALDPGSLMPGMSLPGRPERPELVPPLGVKHRSMHTVEGRAAMIHALAHIEFNAINLALDAIWRFTGMPPDYYADWLRVAGEEALHFNLLRGHLATLGYDYGDFPAHNSLWDMAEKTAGDVLARIALVPRTMEARGLDASPPVRAKLAQAGDAAAAAILDIILRDEIGHVATGNRWFGWLCRQRGLDPVATYEELAARYKAPVPRGPFNLEARRAAGFSDAEMAAFMPS